MFLEALKDHADCMNRLVSLEPVITEAAEMMIKTLCEGGKILVCGNGGSAADAQHFAAELVGRFEKERQAWPCISLATDTSNLTAIGNDYGYDAVFSRQVQGLGRSGDLLIGISTSGNSPNIQAAVQTAGHIGMKTIGLLGKDGGALSARVDCAVIVPHARTARIQEGHIFILHVWAMIIENRLCSRLAC
ncbi:MAG TPA: D-sedoheptulose 7-phosphate isomerase [Desulfatirhabdiaceae bacterium]|nr:D-sedoheptulose 7-phosphate isomerase [Desulfatirhabdiaceae bacterium]